MDELIELQQEYIEMFDKSFPTMLYGSSNDECIRRIKDCLEKGEPEKTVIDSSVLY